MIEGDINERMARFAPSQNVDPALDVIRQRRGLLPPSSVAPSFAEMPDIAQPEGPDPIVDMMLDRRKERLNSTLYGAMRVDPDQAARAQKLAPDVGVGADMVMRHLPDMERQARLADIERRRLYMNDPVLSNFLEQKEFAEVAHDDVGSLSKVKGIFGSIAEIPTSVSEGFRRGIATYELAGLLDKQRQRGGSVDVIEQAAIDSINEEIAALGKESGFWESATNIVTLNLAQAPEYVEPIVTGGVAGGAAGAALGLGGGPLAPATVPVGMATGIGLGLKAGAVTGAFEASRRLETALLYGQAREEGLDHDAANKVALAGGAVSGLLELVGAGIAGKAYSLAVKQVIRRSMNEALKNRTKMAVLKEAGLLYVGGGLGETTTEVAQEIVNQTAIEAGKFMRDKPMIFNDPEEMQAFGDRLVDTAIETAKGMALIGLPGAGVQIYTGTRRAAKAERQQEVIQSLVENRKESKYANRDPQGYERFLAAQSEGTPAETIYIDGMVAQQVLAQSGVTVAELEQVMPGIRQRIVDAVATGGDVTIPTAQFGARLANTDLGTAMLPHVRLSPDAMSMTEVQEFKSRMQDERRLADEALQAAESVRDTFVSEARAVRDWAREQAIAAGQDADAADVAASMYQAFVVTQAAEQNMTPAQFQAAQGVRGIQGIIGEMAPAVAPLEQPSQFMPSGERRTDTPEFKAWSNNAQVIASERSEAHEFTTGKPVVVEALHGSTERGLRRFDVGRAVEVPGAIFFTSNPAVAEQYTYERAYGDIISDQPTGDVVRAYVAFANPMVYQPKGKVVDAIEMGRAIEQAKAAGHDGIIIKNIDDSIGMTGDMGDVYVTWNPTSIKSVDNRGTWSRETANIFEQAGTQPRLMAVHNLSADNLVFADRMGGLSVPSIGVITEERGGVDGFGEITLIGTREMADPYLSRVFESDAYSARFPQPEWPKVSVAKADKFVAQLRDVAQRYDERGIIAVTFDQMVNNPNANKVVEAWLRSPAVMALFLGEKGIDVAPIMRERKSNTGLDWPAIEALRPLYDAVNQDQAYSDVEASPEFIALREAFGNAVRQKYAGVELPEGWLERWATDFSGTMLSNLGRDLRQPETQRVDSSATRDAMDAALDPFKAEYKSWVDTKVRSQFGEPFLRVGRARKPYTLPNIVDVMTSAKVKGEEKGMTFGVGATRAEVAKEFMDLEQMREAAKSAIIDPEEYGKVNKETNALLEAYRNAAIEYTTLTDWRGQTDTWAALDGSMRALANYGKRKRKDAGTMRAALEREGFAVEKMPPALITQAIEAANALFTAPVPYFEAKPQRAVRLGEFAGAVIPSNVEQEVRDILDRNGLAYMTYIAGDEADRQRAVREMARSPEARGEVLFQSPVAPDFYSALERELSIIDAKALTASGWNERFKGLISKGAIKADELEWSGLADYLKMQEGKVSKASVLDFLRGNGVRVERVTMGGPPANIDELGNALARAEMAHEEALERETSADRGDDEAAALAATEAANQTRRAVVQARMAIDNAERATETKYDRYTLPGGTNYREVLLTLPIDQERRRATQSKYNQLVESGVPLMEAMEQAQEEMAREFSSPHWEQPNVLVHLRLNDRVDAEGKRVLFVEELQSDWGQQGKKVGFDDPMERDAARAALPAEEIRLEELTQAWNASRISDPERAASIYTEAEAQRGIVEKLQDVAFGPQKILRAPFVETTDGWLNLGLKQVMLEAVRGNYDRVAFVTGEQSANRYDLSQQVSRVVYQDNYSGGVSVNLEGPPTAGRIIAYDKQGKPVVNQQIAEPSELENYVGKEVAQRLLDAPAQAGNYAGIGARQRELSGLDLKVGGKGMMEFYDKIVPIAMGKLLKKYGGGKISTVEIDTRTPDTGAYYAEPTDADIIPQPGFAITQELVKKLESGLPLFQAAAAPGPRGGFDVRRMMVMLTKASDRTTLWHEFVHFFLHMYTEAAVSGRASERQLNDLDLLLKWFKIDGETPAERLAKWSAMTLDQKRKHHEALTYNAEIYAFEGKAPSAELIPVFERLRAFMLRVYKSIRDDLNAIYRREFGEDLPILTGEVREVMDRMLATDEQIRRQAAINEMKPAFETQEQSQMNDAEWAAYKAMEQEAIEASITDMNKASLRQMQWLSNARSRIVRDMQRKHDRQRKEVSAEVAAAVRVEPVYRAMTYLRTGKFIDADGTEIAVEGPHRLDIKRVKEIYETVPTAESLAPVRATGMPVPTVVQPDLAKLGTGSYGMMGVDGLDPDMVAETFGYSSGDELIRALVAAKPMKEEVAARTDAEMLRRYGDMNTPEAVEAEVQKSLHNEARARMLAVELRWRTKATQPVRVMLEAAKQVARDLIAGKRIRDVRPSDFVAAEARASRDIQRLQNLPDPVAIGMAAQTRAMNDWLAKGMDNATAMAEAIVEGAKAAQAAEERNAALKAQYGADPQQALIRASRAQLYQNQLAAEALRVQDEVAKDIKYLRRVLRDENVKRMGAPAADQIAGLLERYEVAPVSLKRLDERRALTEWLAQQAELGLVPDIAPEIVNEARRVNYREVKVSEFRDLVDAIRQIEHIGKRERKAAQEKLRAAFDALKDEAIQSMKDVAAKRGRKARKELGDEDRKWAQLIAGYDAMQQTIGSIVYVLDGGQRDGPLARMLLFTANDAGNQETTDRAEATLAISKILDPIYRKGQFGGRKLYFPQIDDSLSLEQRMVVALNYGNQSNIDRLLNGEKWTDEQVQPILESLTEEQLNAVQAIWNYLESFKPRVAAQERNLLGREPNWIEPRPFTVRSADGKVVNMAGGYYPAKYNPRRSSMSREMDESVEADRQMREAITAATTTRSYTKNRLDKPPEGGVLSRQMGGLYAGVNEVIHDLAWRTWAMDANRLLRDKEFQTVINSIYGRETYAAIKNWVDATVRGERGNYDVIENIAIGVRRNVSVSAMGLKFITAAIQVTGLIPATVRTGITPMVRAVAYFAANPRESSRIAREKSSFMRNRGRTRYRDLNEIANIVRGESRARRAYLANAYALIGLQQGMVDMSVWWAAYSNAIKEGKAEDAAVSIADQTVIDTQGSGMLKDLSQAMRGGQKQSAYAKLFTSFYQFSNTQYALLSAQLRTAPSMGKAAADAFTILVVGAFIEEMLRTLLKPSPDDEEPEDLAKALIANQIDFVIGLPFGGGELRGIGDMIVGEQAMQYRGPSGLRMVGEVRTFAGQTLQGEFDRAWTRSAINMSGLIWGIPSAQINDTIDGINAAVEGEVEGAEAVLAPITGVRR